MGKSGAGKSTQLSLISGLDLTTGGVVSYNGQDIGVIFQGYNLLTNVTAVENIELSMYNSTKN